MNFGISIIKVLTLSISFIIALWLLPVSRAYSTALYQAVPGGRASSMAGIFAAQADDSSAIWYNPAGIGMLNDVQNDFSIEWGKIPTTFLIGSEADAESSANKNVIKFMGSFIDLKRYSSTQYLKAGVFYRYLNFIESDINIRRNAFNNIPYGRITQETHQISPALSFRFNHAWSGGISIDMLWSEIDCLEYTSCVKNNPYGFGGNLGALYSAALTDTQRLNLSINWRSNVSLAYQSKDDTGIGSVLDEYLLGRPSDLTLGLNYRILAQFGLMNFNTQYTLSKWPSTKINSDTEYDHFGLSSEILLGNKWIQNLALRAGWKQTRPIQSGIYTDYNLYTMGLGFSLYNDHFFDFSLSNYDGQTLYGTTDNFISLSYSYQK